MFDNANSFVAVNMGDGQLASRMELIGQSRMAVSLMKQVWYQHPYLIQQGGPER
jgi:hypothetical protein